MIPAYPDFSSWKQATPSAVLQVCTYIFNLTCVPGLSATKLFQLFFTGIIFTKVQKLAAQNFMVLSFTICNSTVNTGCTNACNTQNFVIFNFVSIVKYVKIYPSIKCQLTE